MFQVPWRAFSQCHNNNTLHRPALFFLPLLLMLVMSHGPTLIDMWLEARKSLPSRQSEWRGGPKLCLYVIYEVLKRSSWYNSEENLVFLCLIWNCDEYVEFGRFEPARQCSEDGFVQQFFQLDRLKFRRKELFHFVLRTQIMLVIKRQPSGTRKFSYSSKKKGTGWAEEIAPLVKSPIATQCYQMTSSYAEVAFVILIGSHRKRIHRNWPQDRGEMGFWSQGMHFFPRTFAWKWNNFFFFQWVWQAQKPTFWVPWRLIWLVGLLGTCVS